MAQWYNPMSNTFGPQKRFWVQAYPLTFKNNHQVKVHILKINFFDTWVIFGYLHIIYPRASFGLKIGM
jgi:hypothetical protein